jgi:4-hydroxybenzoate polyprenyltransferase
VTGLVARARLFLTLARPPLLYLLVLSGALGVAAGGAALDVVPLVRTLLVVAPLMVCAVALNDLSDVAVDRINLAADPTRPLVSGRADVSAMHAVAVVSAAAALAVAASIDVVAVLVAGAGLALAAAHSLPPVRLSGRGIVGPLLLPFSMVAVPFVVGVLAARGSFGTTTIGLLLALYVGFIGRMLLKDFRDVRGDALLGKRTFLVRRGRRATCALSAGFWVAGSAALAVLPSLSWTVVVAWSALLTVALLLLAQLASSTSHRRDERLVGAVAVAGRGLLLVLLAHFGLVALGAGPARSAATLALIVGVMLVWVRDVLRRDRFVAGPTWPADAKESQR